LTFDPREGYERRAGVEFPANGLQVLRVWEEEPDGFLREHDLKD
jgi:hypothetical protein